VPATWEFGLHVVVHFSYCYCSSLCRGAPCVIPSPSSDEGNTVGEHKRSLVITIGCLVRRHYLCPRTLVSPHEQRRRVGLAWWGTRTERKSADTVLAQQGDCSARPSGHIPLAHSNRCRDSNLVGYMLCDAECGLKQGGIRVV
jgi:hypothetical protein